MKLQVPAAQGQQRQQFLAQIFQAAALMVDGAGGLALFVGVALRGAQHVGVADDAGHGGFEFMGERAHKILALLHAVFQRGDLFLHGVSHLVKAAADLLDLVAGMQRRAVGVVAPGNARAGRREHPQRAGDLPRQQRQHSRAARQHDGLQP